MLVPLTVRDHIDRADLVYGKRVGVIDEPDQPARPLPNLTYADFAERAKAMAKGFEKLNVPLGGRVALVSQNSSRMLAFLFGTAAWGRVGVPINFRLNREEIKYIIEHSGSEILLVDPELADSLGDLPAKNVIVLGSETDRDIFSTGEP